MGISTLRRRGNNLFMYYTSINAKSPLRAISTKSLKRYSVHNLTNWEVRVGGGVEVRRELAIIKTLSSLSCHWSVISLNLQSTTGPPLFSSVLRVPENHARDVH